MIGFRTASARRRALAIVLYAAALWLGGCDKAPSAEKPPAEEAKVADAQEASEDVVLTSDQAGKMGLVVEPVKSADYIAETLGYGVVMAHDAIAGAVAELTTARLTERQSRAALERSQRLAGTPGATSADVADNASRQAATDTAAVLLAEQRLSGIIGFGHPWKPDENDSILRELASGRIKLLRATFPLGALPGAVPKSLRTARLDADQALTRAVGWEVNSVWDAPADAGMPGRSVFGLLKSSDAAEGERLLVWASGSGAALSGVLIPASAVVISDGKTWCFVERKSLAYHRQALDTARPLTDGYFVTDGIMAGDKLVISGAGLLLARATNPSSEAE